ncbi:MAG TPA: hypothetical protein VNH84_12120 [Candidatus Saccharimonadales bacterium]|nr:hypothetical protein [Candidatus Saccharimonadales bacterium]
MPTLISILSEAGDLIEEVATDAEGNFAVHLKPGVYWVAPKVFTMSSSGPRVCLLEASAVQVTVEKHVLTTVVVIYYAFCLD